ncbi:hypothetical protein RHSIM_Rhsim10G0080700 [Rhododendron simsii]|uniref:Uncharacterized protein n=1 Tax=Rhododendron simsii TaxID=118357 RepID=A0A834GA34_RHOSS|nr:hypothetical protein RHSIM_Rhsim10G0080700 [Rhododendron simsii]
MSTPGRSWLLQQRHFSSRVRTKTKRFKWTPDQHDNFVKSAEQLGGLRVATGSGILELIAVEGLSLKQVDNHLNHCRLKVGASPKSFPSKIHLQIPPSSEEGRTLVVSLHPPSTAGDAGSGGGTVEGATKILSQIASPIKHLDVLAQVGLSLGGFALMYYEMMKNIPLEATNIGCPFS